MSGLGQRAPLGDTHPLPGELVSGSPPRAALVSVDGTAFAGRYRLRCLRGEGGMAMVYDAVDLGSGGLVAVKMLRYELIRNQEARLRFRCEGQMAARVAHPNVVALHGVNRDADDRPFLVMEHLQGHTLGEIIAREGALPVERALRIAIQACRALRAVHCAGIIHRDVKPDNLFVCPGPQGTDQVKLLDFGIGKVCAPQDPVAQTIEALDCGRVVGTPHYMAPEQVCAPETVNEQTDVFALGVVLREALTGVRPHDGKSGGTIIDALLTDPMSAAAAYHPPVGAQHVPLIDLDEVIALAHAPDRRQRYTSARSFGDALAAVLRALAVSSARAA